MDASLNSKAKHFENGLVKFPPNVHGLYVEVREDGGVNLIARQNDTRLCFVLDDDDRKHLAALLMRKGS
ncbi:MAG: hypothetical protein MN733_31840 [Nitrososphaera sp.]|nr:hypothetical protein [Nitrososphaera sp.]